MRKETLYICEHCNKTFVFMNHALECEHACAEKKRLEQERVDKQNSCQHKWNYFFEESFDCECSSYIESYMGISRDCHLCKKCEDVWKKLQDLSKEEIQEIGILLDKFQHIQPYK